MIMKWSSYRELVMIARFCTFFLTLISMVVLSAPLSHESQPDINPSQKSEAPSITREEALISGLKALNLDPSVLEKIISFTRKNPNIDEKNFYAFIDTLAKEENSLLNEEQAQKIKELFNKELGNVEYSEKGKEFGKAAQKVLNQKNLSASVSPKSQQANIDSALMNKLLENLLNNNKENSKETGLDKLLLPLQELLKSLGQKQMSPQEGKVGGGIPRSLLDALRGDSKNKDGKDDGDKLAEGLKDALNRHAPAPPFGKKDDFGPKNEMMGPPSKGESSKKNNEETPKMTASKSSSDKDKKDDKKDEKKGPGDFLSGKSDKDKESEPELTKKEETKDLLSPDLTDKLPFNEFSGKSSNPQLNEKEGQSVMMGSGNGPSFKGENLGISGSGSGPNIATLGGSAPSLGNSAFDGDPFSGIGRSYFGGGPFTYDFSKNVEFGSAVGDMSADESNPYFVGNNSSQETLVKNNRNLTYQIVYPAKETNKPNSIISFVGTIGKNLCNGSWKDGLELCSSIIIRGK